MSATRPGRRRSTFGARAVEFFGSLEPPRMPRGITVMNPYADPGAAKYAGVFFRKFYDDNRPRTLVLGINPGRFGAGITGVMFTDPVALAEFCGIPNEWPRKRELSSVFIYDVINRMGGAESFYGRFFVSAASPLGFTKDGVNLNYYDVPELQRRIEPFIVDSIRRQIGMGGRTDRAIVLGRGANAKFLLKLNETHGFFGRLDILEHPRWILQYRRKAAAQYVERYAEVLGGGEPLRT